MLMETPRSFLNDVDDDNGDALSHFESGGDYGKILIDTQSMRDEVDALRNVHFPGRLSNILKSGHSRMSKALQFCLKESSSLA